MLLRVSSYFPRQKTQKAIVTWLALICKTTDSNSVRISAAKGVVTVSRRIRHTQTRKEYVRSFLLQLTQGTACERKAVVECAEAGLETYSPEEFENLFSEIVLSLVKDPEAEVRLRLASTLPRLAPQCQGHTGFEEALVLLRSDEDAHVLACMTDFVSCASAHLVQYRQDTPMLRKRRREECSFFTREPTDNSRNLVRSHSWAIAEHFSISPSAGTKVHDDKKPSPKSAGISEMTYSSADASGRSVQSTEVWGICSQGKESTPVPVPDKPDSKSEVRQVADEASLAHKKDVPQKKYSMSRLASRLRRMAVWRK